jgi:hypothetical protein
MRSHLYIFHWIPSSKLPQSSRKTIASHPITTSWANSIRPIPQSYNHTGLLDWFRHIAIIPQKQTTAGILILDINQTLEHQSRTSGAYH